MNFNTEPGILAPFGFRATLMMWYALGNMKRQMVLDLVSPFVDDDKHAVSIVGAELTLLVEVSSVGSKRRECW